jgi:2-polyprenyl-3-methyl-5-hydroxy-6-metoxy-1,4-benzoquinol methylase
MLPAHRIVACRRCHIARTEPPPSPVEYDEQDFHGQFTYRSADDLPLTWRRGLELQKNLLLRHLPSPSAPVLEIGCGQGLLLGLLVRAGLRARGVEPSRSATHTAVAAGLDVVEGYFSRATAPAGPCGAVVVSHVLEHVEHPEKFLADIAAVAPGGLLLLVQANWRGWVPRKTKSLWHAWAEGHHYWHFTPAGLQRWLVAQGCTPVALEYSSLEHADYWLARLARWFPGASDQFHLLVRLPPA